MTPSSTSGLAAAKPAPVYGTQGRQSASTAAAEGIPTWQWVVAVLGLFAVGDPWISINKTWGGDDPAPWIRSLWIVFYALFLPFLIANLVSIGRVAVRTPILTALAIAALLSTAWSILPEVSFRRSVGVIYWLLFAYVIAARFSWTLLIKALALAYLALAVGSLLMVALFPSIGIMSVDHPGAWRGIWTHKNQTGGHMAVAILAFLSAAWLFPKQRRLFLFGVVLALILVLMSRSATALVSTLLIFAFLGFSALARASTVLAIIAAAGASTVALFFGGVMLLEPEWFFSAIGRDATLTGRTDIWHYIERSIAQSPWIGYGYGAFWEDLTGPAWWVRAGTGWAVPNSHNGWLELALGLGLIGLAAFAVTFAFALVRSVLAFAQPQAGLFAPAFMMLFAIQSFGEGAVVEDNNLIWTIFTIVAAKLALDRSASFQALGKTQ